MSRPVGRLRAWQAGRLPPDRATSADRPTCRPPGAGTTPPTVDSRGLLRAYRRCSLLRRDPAPFGRLERHRGRRTASSSISARCGPDALSCCSLCGGSAAGRNQTRSSWHVARQHSPKSRCPKWTGSKLPPRMPNRMPPTPIHLDITADVTGSGPDCQMAERELGDGDAPHGTASPFGGRLDGSGISGHWTCVPRPMTILYGLM